MSLITPEFLSRMRQLNLPVQRTLPGFSYGPHRGQTRGAGLEFSEYRRYEPGDDLRRIDWKLAARSDRYFVREAERDSQIPVWLLLDCSGSMQAGSVQPTTNAACSKVEFGAAVLAALAMMAARQGDAVGLALLTAALPDKAAVPLPLLPVRRGQRALQRLIAALTRVQASGRLPVPTESRALGVQMRTRSLCVLVSDFLDDSSLVWLRWLRAGGHDVVAIALDTIEERELPLPAGMLAGYEGEPVLPYSPNQRAGYLQARADQREQWARWARQHQVQWCEAAIEQTPDTVVQRLLRARAPGGAAWS